MRGRLDLWQGFDGKRSILSYASRIPNPNPTQTAPVTNKIGGTRPRSANTHDLQPDPTVPSPEPEPLFHVL